MDIALMPVAVLGLCALAVVLLGLRRFYRQTKRTREFARRYAESGASYAPRRARLGTQDKSWEDQVSGVRNGYSFAVYSEVREFAPVSYSAGGVLESGDVVCHHASIPLARRTPELRVWNRDDRNTESDHNAGAVATGFSEFDERFLVFCDDLAFVREVMTQDLVAWLLAHSMTETYATGARGQFGLARRGIELRDGELSLEEIGGRLDPDGVFAGVDYLVELLGKLPVELVPQQQHVTSREGER